MTAVRRCVLKGISERSSLKSRLVKREVNRKSKSSAFKAESNLLKLFIQRRIPNILKVRKNANGGDDQWL